MILQGSLPDSAGSAGAPGLTRDLNLSSLQYSLSGSLYTLGIVVSSFLFAALSKSFNEQRLLGWGMLIWCCGVLGTGLCRSFSALAVLRVRAGCPVFSHMPPPLIDGHLTHHPPPSFFWGYRC